MGPGGSRGLQNRCAAVDPSRVGSTPMHSRHSHFSGGGVYDLLKRITVDPLICHGKACIAGTRVPVHLLLEMMANGDSFADILASYPFLTDEDLRAALAYAAQLASQEITVLQTA